MTGDSETASEQVPKSEMSEDDWRDVMASELVDVAGSELGDDPVFIFEHPALGKHGFRYRSRTVTLEPVSIKEVGEDGD